MGGRSGKFVWVCMMAVMAFITLGLGVIGLTERIRMEPARIVLNPSMSDTGRQALAEEAKRSLSGHIISAAVQYTFKDGKTLIQNDARLKPYEVSSLLAGQSLSVYYDKERPHAVFSKDELPQPAGWLISGLVLAAVAWFAVGLLRKEYDEQYADSEF